MSRAIDGTVLTDWISGECKSPSCPTNESAFGMRIMKHIERMPTIEPERKKGKWMYGENEFGNDGYYCSVCGNFVPWKYGEYDIDFIREFLFCNKCGADMRGEQDG